MKIHHWGLNRLKTYKIEDGYAIEEPRPGKSSSMPLAGAKIDREASLLKMLIGLGNITISRDGKTQVWSNIRNTKQVQAALERVSKGLPLEAPPAAKPDDRWRVTIQPPPSDVIFGDQVALIPSIGKIFDRPLWVHHWEHDPTTKFGHHWESGQWLNEGDSLGTIYIRRHAHPNVPYNFVTWLLSDSSMSFWYGQAPIKCPASGLVLDCGKGDIEDAPIEYNGQRFSAALLLPENAIVPESTAEAFAEFHDLCTTHRQAIFRHPAVKNSYSDQRIDEAINRLKTAQIVVTSVSNLPAPERYTDSIKEFKRKYPANFPPSTQPPPAPASSAGTVDEERIFKREFHPDYGRFPKADLRQRVYEAVGPEITESSDVTAALWRIVDDEGQFTVSERDEIFRHFMAALKTEKDLGNS